MADHLQQGIAGRQRVCTAQGNAVALLTQCQGRLARFRIAQIGSRQAQYRISGRQLAHHIGCKQSRCRFKKQHTPVQLRRGVCALQLRRRQAQQFKQVFITGHALALLAAIPRQLIAEDLLRSVEQRLTHEEFRFRHGNSRESTAQVEVTGTRHQGIRNPGFQANRRPAPALPRHRCRSG
ncbi:hypothetical protein D3C81_1522990 [compost metagenome]